MRVVVIAHSNRGAGGLVFALNFLRQLRQTASRHQFLVIAPKGVGYEDVALPDGSEMHIYQGRTNAISRYWHDTYRLPGIVRRWNPDLVLGLGNQGMLDPPCKQAITITDSHFFYPPSFYPGESWHFSVIKAFLKRKLRRCLPRTQLVMCQTPVALKRFAETYVYDGKTALFPTAVSEYVKDTREPKKPEVLESGPSFNLFVLSIFYPHKNLKLIAELFEKYDDELSDVRCIMTVGPDDHTQAAAFLGRLRRAGLTERIVAIGRIGQEQISDYCTHSQAMLLPTTLESFSGTYLDAMFHRLPILTSDLDFAHYVCGDAACYFDPWDVDSLYQAVVRVRDDAAYREQLVEAGQGRVSQFFISWEEIATNVIGELESLVETA